MSDLVQFAAEIRAARAALGWSQTELARRTAVTQRAIYCIEQIIVRPKKQTDDRIIEALPPTALISSAQGMSVNRVPVRF
jgi:predicted transcriptional regulator